VEFTKGRTMHKSKYTEINESSISTCILSFIGLEEGESATDIDHSFYKNGIGSLDNKKYNETLTISLFNYKTDTERVIKITK